MVDGFIDYQPSTIDDNRFLEEEMACVVSVNISRNKGQRKKPVDGSWEVIEGCGLKGDGHANIDPAVQNELSHRQISLLALESIEKMQEMGLDVKPGNFAENITTSGIDLLSLPIDTQLSIGDEVLLEVSQIGKVCHTRCAIYYQAGDCVMPKEGIFFTLKGVPLRSENFLWQVRQ